MPAPAPLPASPPTPTYRTTWRILIAIAVSLVLALGVHFVRTIFAPKASTQLGQIKIEEDAPANSEPVSSKPAPPSAPRPAPVSPPARTVATRGGDVVHQVLPDVPQSARNTISGTIKVNVRVEVDPSGKVASAKLASPGPSKYFAGLALKAAQQWEFSSPVTDGKPAASAWLLQFRFKRTSTQASLERVNR